jgi:ADP-heptose:LPS heptosyltransferase
VRFVNEAIRRLLFAGLKLLRALSNRQDRFVATPRRVLLLNGAHSGDIVISTGLIPVLKSAYPGVGIGFAVGGWSANVLSGHAEVMAIHRIDHWRTNRSSAGWVSKWMQYRRTRSRAMREIRDFGYDWAICLHPHVPDLLTIAWQAGIPVRAAFYEAPCAPLATHLARYPGWTVMVTEGACQGELLRELGLSEEHLRLRQSTLPPDNMAALNEVRGVLGCSPDRELPAYFVLHMGAGSRGREMAMHFWRELVQMLASHRIVMLTGRGERECKHTEELANGMPNVRNACDRLSWAGLVAAVRNAEQVFSVDTAIGHIAAAVGTPCQVVATGISHLARWRPESGRVVVWSNHVDCAPCFRPLGCHSMQCLKGITPVDLAGKNSGMSEP